MSHRIQIPETALLELEAVEEMEWDEGVSIQELIDWINQVVDRFRPESIGEQSRASEAFTPRSFRHYQTLGCIDPPIRSGRSGRYGFRQYLQGLVIRKLLWERVPSDRIVELLEHRSNEELKQLLLDNLEILPVAGGMENSPALASTWKRISIAPGIELHLAVDRRPLDESEKEQVLAMIREQL